MHHLRSTLDHLVHALVVHNGRKPTRQHQFPICTTRQRFIDACERGQIEGVGPEAKQLITEAQPYTQDQPDDTVLCVLREFDNIDKHRLLVVVVTAVKIGDEIHISPSGSMPERQKERDELPAIVGLGIPGAKPLSEDGVVVFSIRLAKPVPEFEANAEIVPQLVFEKCGRVEHGAILPILRGLHAGTRHTVESFSPCFD